MERPPVSYPQTDPRWAAKDYSAKGERTTIGASGCGPTAMAMVLATWADQEVTPATECAWALAHGYKAPRQGTYYGYFPPAAKRYGLTCRQLNWTSLYGNPASAVHAQAQAALDRGCLVIACMGKGLWTSSGHFVLVWKIAGNVVYINDPASTRTVRTRGDDSLFKGQVKYYWVIDPPKQREEETMTGEEILQALTEAQAYALVEKAMRFGESLPEPHWSKAEGHWQKAIQQGLTSGENPEGFAKRCEVAAMLGRGGLL